MVSRFKSVQGGSSISNADRDKAIKELFSALEIQSKFNEQVSDRINTLLRKYTELEGKLVKLVELIEANLRMTKSEPNILIP